MDSLQIIIKKTVNAKSSTTRTPCFMVSKLQHVLAFANKIIISTARHTIPDPYLGSILDEPVGRIDGGAAALAVPEILPLVPPLCLD